MYRKPSLTLAIPCFNAEHSIQSTLDSIMRQTHPPDEVVVVDDGSTDNSNDIIKHYATVRLFSHNENKGIACSRNTAWENASCEIVLFTDADTILHPNLIETVANGYRQDDIGGVGGRGIERIQLNRNDRWRKDVLFQSWGNSAILNVPFLFGIVSSYRRSVLESLGGFDPFFKASGEDLDFGYRVQKTGYRLVYHPGAVVYHLRTDTRQSIEQMTYRHCLWGFLSQRKNLCFANKLSFAGYVRIFVKQIFLDGLFKKDLSYIYFTLGLLIIIWRAWFNAKQMAQELGWS